MSAENSKITNCSVSGVVQSAADDTGGTAGGIVGEVKEGTLIENCESTASVREPRGAGVIAGSNAGTIRNTTANGLAHCSQYYVGGFVGVNTSTGVIENCSSAGKVTRVYCRYASNDCGGFVGDNQGIIRDCFSSTTVDSSQDGAGFCGRNWGRIESCVSAGDVTASAAGAVFVLHNGEASGNIYAASSCGVTINCFGYGNVNVESDTHKYYFLRTYADYNSIDGPVEASIVANCTVNYDIALGAGSGFKHLLGGAFARTTEQMQSKAFVDTLNMVAAIAGTSTWEYVPGDYPKPTGQKANNIGDYFAGGNGTEETPYLIANKTQLENFAQLVNLGWDFRRQYLRLTADIEINAPQDYWGEQMPEQWTPMGGGYYYYGGDNTWACRYFVGNFDGDFHNIDNMYINTVEDDKAGLFGGLNNGAVIRNLSMDDAWVRGDGCIGILVAYISGDTKGVQIFQVNTSGQIESGGDAGGISGRPWHCICNSYSSAKVKALTYARPVSGFQNYIGGTTYSTDTIGNFYFTGTLEMNATRNYGTFGNEISINCYYDSTVFDYHTSYGRSTEYLQSKEFANELNYYVAQFNEKPWNNYKLRYWQWNDGGYPTWTTEAPPHTITYVTNGGSYLTPQPVLDDSRIYAPPVPEKGNSVFYGWCTNEELTEVFDFKNTQITGSMTLYAKWQDVVVPDYTPFQNPFATTYVIRTLEQLYGFAGAIEGVDGVISAVDFTGKTVKLGADIMMNDTIAWKKFGDDIYGRIWQPMNNKKYFNGTFDGDGYSLIGMYIDADKTLDSGESGLFEYTPSECVIKNLKMKSCKVISDVGNVGLIAGYNRGTIDNCEVQGIMSVRDCTAGLVAGVSTDYLGIGLVTNCSVKGKIEFTGGEYYGSVGGVIGRLSIAADAVISGCHADVEILAGGAAGGIIGEMEYGSIIENCSAKGFISGKNRVGGIVGKESATNGSTIRNISVDNSLTLYGEQYVGGIVGQQVSENSILENCNSSIDLNLQASSVGGIAGETYALITNCHSTGTIISTGDYVGGLVGSGSTVERSYATGKVSGHDIVGGIAGNASSINYCYAMNEVSGNNFVGGIMSGKNGRISYCFTRGTVKGNNYVGGLLGGTDLTSRPFIDQCYSASTVIAEGENIGAVCGTVTGTYGYGLSYYDNAICSLDDLSAIPTPTAYMKTIAN